ncbi:hypothetical protein EDD11_004024 [Mortierella claussenii]|nr:hypothetical protein EDD11_004024 [Mortierella claussenii]
MPRHRPLTETELELIQAYNTILNEPFEDKYEDKWEDEPFDRALEDFKCRVQEIGFADPFELLSRFNITSYETMREQFKRGPALCFRPGWISPLVGEVVDTSALLAKCQHVSGPKFDSSIRVVILDFWASWCDPCLQAGPELSDLADEFEGRVALVGINNENIFDATIGQNIERLQDFLEENRDGFRYTIYIDTEEGYAKQVVYNPGGYRGIPCVILLADGVVKYVGSPQENFRPTLEDVLETIEAESAREE